MDRYRKLVVLTFFLVAAVQARAPEPESPNNAKLEGKSRISYDDITYLDSNRINLLCNTVDGVLFNKANDTLIYYPRDRHGAYTIPDNVTAIREGAFSICTSLTSITIPNSVTSIGEWAFRNCTGLTSITIPNSVMSIDTYAFSDCINLTSVTLSNNLTYIGDGAFMFCYGLTSVMIPNGLTYLSDDMFRACTSLTSITIPNSVETIGKMAFQDCVGLTSITIPNSVKTIGEWAFYGCISLTSITIPESVTSIDEFAFFDCTGLTTITVQNSIPPQLRGPTFPQENTVYIYVPKGSADVYQYDMAYGWWGWHKIGGFLEIKDRDVDGRIILVFLSALALSAAVFVVIKKMKSKTL